MGGIFSNEEPKPDLSKYITTDQLSSKNYINKDVNDLSNYYTKNYINTKYITTDQLTSKNYITKDVNNLTNYQTKGNYLRYFNNDKNIFELESDYMSIVDKNKNKIIKFDKNSIDINTKINLNNEINIGDYDNYFNIKKEDECLVTRYYKNQKVQDNNSSVTIVKKICTDDKNSNLENNSIIEEQSSTEDKQKKLVKSELNNFLKSMNYSIYIKEDDSKQYVDVSNIYKNESWIENLEKKSSDHLQLKEMVKYVKKYKISINFDIKYLKKKIIENVIKYPFIKDNLSFAFLFSGKGPDGCSFKVIDSNTINDTTKQPFIVSTGKSKDGIFSFYESDLNQNSDIFKFNLSNDNNNSLYFIFINYNKFITLDDYITIMLEPNCEITVYGAGFSF